MKLQRRIMAPAIGTLAFMLGITALQAPSAAANDGPLNVVAVDLVERNPEFVSRAPIYPGQIVRWRFPKWTAEITTDQPDFSYQRRERKLFMGLVPSPSDCRAMVSGSPAIGTWREVTAFSVVGRRSPSRLSTEEIVTSFDVPENADGQYLCAWQRANAVFILDSEVGIDTAVGTSEAIVGPQVQTIPKLQTLYPRAPYYSSNSGTTSLHPGEEIWVTADVGNNFANENVQGRWVTVSFPNFATPGTCRGQQGELTTDIREFGAASVTRPATIPESAGGKYMCLQQSIITDSMDEVMSSEPVTFPISRSRASYVPISAAALGVSLEKLLAATSRLEQLQSQPNVDRAALAAAAAAAEEARRQAQAAAQAAQGQAQQQGAAALPAAQIAQVQQAAQAATTVVEKAIGESAVGKSRVSAVTALAVATGFDPFTTPILQTGEKNASGVSIKVSSPESIRQKKRLRTKLEVLDPVTRGGMRQYLLDLNGPTPKLLLKRTGFVPKGEKNKRYWISKNFQPGTYGLLTTFLPSTPGMQGIAVYDTIEVTEAPKKKKKKGKKKNRN